MDISLIPGKMEVSLNQDGSNQTDIKDKVDDPLVDRYFNSVSGLRSDI